MYDVQLFWNAIHVHVFLVSFDRDNGELEQNWLLEKAWRDKERGKGKFHLELHTYTYTLILNVWLAFLKYNVHVFRLSLNRNKGNAFWKALAHSHLPPLYSCVVSCWVYVEALPMSRDCLYFWWCLFVCVVSVCLWLYVCELVLCRVSRRGHVICNGMRKI